MSRPRFKVIVIGAGPVGLTAAHCLAKAGIDFVVLERRPSVVEDVGASLVLGTPFLRVANQLGLLDQFLQRGQEVLHRADFTTDGHKTKDTWVYYLMRENHGSFAYMHQRAHVLEILYEGLSPEYRARVLPDKKLFEIDTTDEGVCVTCADGTKYEGSMVLGADGIHSRTRAVMQGLNAHVGDEETPFSVEYKTMWCSLPRVWEHPPGELLETHGDSSSIQLINSKERSWIFLYERLASPRKMSDKERVVYTADDVDDVAAKYADMPIGGGTHKLKDMWPKRRTAGMSDLAEGILKHWSAGRIVLAGDSCHSFTPNAGLGFNNGAQDVFALVNELHRCVKEAENGLPSQAELTKAFAKYQSSRTELVCKDNDVSAKTTRLSAWPNVIYWLFDRYILPSIPGFDTFMVNHVSASSIAQAVALNFLPGEEVFQGRIPWLYPIRNSH